MRTSLRLSDVFQALVLCGSIVGMSAPLDARADEAGTAAQMEGKARHANNVQARPCGLPSLRGESGISGGLDLVGVWRCMQNVVLPERYSDTTTDSRRPAHDKMDGFKLGLKVRHDQVTLTVGVKW